MQRSLKIVVVAGAHIRLPLGIVFANRGTKVVLLDSDG